MSKKRAETGVGSVVSSMHPSSGAMPALSELEFGLILLGQAFDRWMVRCMEAAGVPNLSPLDVLVLHTIAHRGRMKRAADICLVLNIEDTHLVTYSLKKLESRKLVLSGHRGSEKAMSLSAKGEGVVKHYRQLREALLVRPVKGAGADEKRMSEIAGMMRALSGHYDQAARVAASL